MEILSNEFKMRMVKSAVLDTDLIETLKEDSLKQGFYPDVLSEISESSEFGSDFHYQILDQELEEKACVVSISSVPSKAAIAIKKINEPGGEPDKEFTPLGIVTPSKLSLYPAKRREIRLTLQGYEPYVIVLSKETGLEPKPGSNLEVHAQLFKLGLGPYDGILRVLSEPARATIKLWFRQVGSESEEDWRLFRENSIFITPQNFYLPSRQKFEVRQGEVRTFEVEYKVNLTKEGFESWSSDPFRVTPGSFLEILGKLRQVSFGPEFQPIL